VLTSEAMQARILGGASDPNVVARSPGVFVAPAASPSYGVLKGLVDVGGADFLGETYLPDGELAVAVAVRQARRNVAGQISIGADFFVSALRDYGDWQEKWWREAIQNSVDAGATEVDCVVTMLDSAGKPTESIDGARTVEVSCQDNGRGMDEETLLNKFLVLGGTTKRAGESVGGFGKAKELLLLPWMRWHLHSRALLVEGHGIAYDVKHLPHDRAGTGITVWMPTDRYTKPEDAVSFLKKCWIPGVRFTVNGQNVRANQKVGQAVAELPGKLEITHKKTSKDFDRPTCLVRSRGLYMFDRWISSDVKGVMIVEVTGPSIELLSANRDGFRDYDSRRTVDDFINKLAADVKSATKAAKNIIKKKFAGTGKFRSKPEEVEAAILMSIGSVEPVDPGGNRPKMLSAEQAATMLQIITDVGVRSEEDESASGLDLRASAVAVEAMLDVPVAGPSHVEAIAKQLAWEPDFYVYNEIEEFHVPKRLMPDGMTPQVQKLARFWAELCRFVLIQLGSRQSYGVGWHFDVGEDGSYTGASFIEENGENWLMLNPFIEGDPKRGELYSLTDRSHVNWIYAAAVHECTHMADGITRHNEAFAAALTRNVARTANRGRQIDAIRKAVVARGAKLGKLEVLE
jgi:hypothetical protein